MKKILFTFIVSFVFCSCNAQNVGIGTNNPDASAKLDVSSSNSGFLPPRMTYAQRNAIVNPAAGLILYCTDCNSGSGEMNYFNGNTWMNMTIGTASNVVANLPSVTIGTQIWTTQNLNVSTYSDGTPIPKVEDAATWGSLTSGAYCYYNNDSATYAAVYGKLYNWYAVAGIYDSSSLSTPSLRKKLAPEGWHVPSDVEWNKLAIFIDPSSDTTCPNCSQSSTTGGALKEAGLIHWLSPNTGATNSSGFAGLPGGLRYPDNLGFANVGVGGYWWASTDYDASAAASSRNLYYGNSNQGRGFGSNKLGLSVRCVRD